MWLDEDTMKRTEQILELFRKPNGVESRNAMAENPSAKRGGGGIANNGAKGHICENIEPGTSRTLLSSIDV